MICQGQVYQRAASCLHCGHILHRHAPDKPWMAVNLSDDPQCSKAPNKGHSPAAEVISNPNWQGEKEWQR